MVKARSISADGQICNHPEHSKVREKLENDFEKHIGSDPKYKSSNYYGTKSNYDGVKTAHYCKPTLPTLPGYKEHTMLKIGTNTVASMKRYITRNIPGGWHEGTQLYNRDDYSQSSENVFNEHLPK